MTDCITYAPMCCHVHFYANERRPLSINVAQMGADGDDDDRDYQADDCGGSRDWPR